MTYLNKRETFYFIVFALGALAVMLGTLAFWASEQPSCWDLHASEQQAILNCEN